jgi:hypothetical protein
MEIKRLSLTTQSPSCLSVTYLGYKVALRMEVLLYAHDVNLVAGEVDVLGPRF